MANSWGVFQGLAHQEEAVHRAALDMNCSMQSCLVGVSVHRIVREQIEG